MVSITKLSFVYGEPRKRCPASILTINSEILEWMPLHCFAISISMPGRTKRKPCHKTGTPKVLNSAYVTAAEPLRLFGTLALFLWLSAAANAQISLVHVTTCGLDVAFPGTICSIPSTGSGNLLVVGLTSGTNTGSAVIASMSDNVGNTYLEAGPARAVDTNPLVNDMADIWYAKNTLAGATALTISPNPTGTVGTVIIWEFSGVDTSAPLDQTGVLDSQAATTTPAAPPVTASADELVISIANVQNAVTGILSGNPFVLDSTASGNGWAHFITTSSGSYGAQWAGSLGTYSAITTSFKGKSSTGSSAGGACDLNSDGVVNVVDVQMAIDMDLGLLTCTADIAGANVCNPTVVQRVVNAALGQACVVTVPHYVSLTWVTSVSPSVAGYNIYRGSTSGGPYTKLNSSLIVGTNYTDNTVQSGQSYYYVGTAVDTSSTESGYSNQTMAVIPTP